MFFSSNLICIALWRKKHSGTGLNVPNSKIQEKINCSPITSFRRQFRVEIFETTSRWVLLKPKILICHIAFVSINTIESKDLYRQVGEIIRLFGNRR